MGGMSTFIPHRSGPKLIQCCMKQSFLSRVLLTSAFLIYTSILFSQDMIRQQNCEGNLYQDEVDSLKKYYASEGYSVLREASMMMESEYEMPIILPMAPGVW